MVCAPGLTYVKDTIGDLVKSVITSKHSFEVCDPPQRRHRDVCWS